MQVILIYTENWFRKMLAFLKRPYPYISFSSKDILSNFLIGCFVAFFLIVFKPFGVSEWQTEHKLLKLIGFGIVSFIFPFVFKVISDFILKRYNPEETWKVWKETVALILVLLFIAFGNLCYGNLIKISHFNFQELVLALAATFLLGIFPIFANVAIKYNRFLYLNQKDAQLMESQVLGFQDRIKAPATEQSAIEEIITQERLVLVSENGKDSVELKADELLYIESADNYSKIMSLSNGILNKQLIRGSLKSLESQIHFNFIIRCHRSYIVNLKQIAHVKGNAQGYKIEFKADLCDVIAVSRNHSKALFERLKSLT